VQSLPIIRAVTERQVKRAALWLLVLAMVAVFVRAGFWQAGRAAGKDQQLARAALVLEARTPLPLADALADMPAWVALEGRFDDAPPLRLDNQRRGADVGVHVYRLFHSDDGARLWVDLGWRPLPADRALLSEPPPPSGAQRLSGLLVPPPSAGLAMGPAMMPAADGGWLALRLTPEALAGASARPGPAASAPTALAPAFPNIEQRAVLRLNPALPGGYERDLHLLANTLPPDKHRGYALQWFGFAAGLLILSLYLQFRRP